MAYTSKPWTLEAQEPKLLKMKKEEIRMRELKDKVKENIPVSAVRIVKFLNKNKDKKFTNKQIAMETGLSESTVSGITEKLEEIGILKNPKSYRSILNHRPTITYQSAKGYRGESTIEREYEGCIAKVLTMFEKNVNKVYSTLQITEELKEVKNKVAQAISILLATDKIKLIDKKEAPIYQHIKGNKVGIPIAKEADKNYITLKSYLKMNGIKDCPKEIKEKIAKEKGHSRIFGSNNGLVKEYEISYLQKVVGVNAGNKEKKEKKGLLERIRVW